MFSKKSKVINFLKKQGLFIALIVCIAGIAVAAVLSLDAAKEKSPDVNVQKQESPTLEEQLQASPSPSVSMPGYPYDAMAPSASPSASPSAVSNQPRQSAQTMMLPVNGEVIKAFSGNKLVYNATLNMWKTHNGIDIACKEGSEICAAMAGEVESVITDPQRGVSVTVLHTEDQKTIYVGLASADVKQGDKVNSGQKLGLSGVPAFESSEGGHVHFEYVVGEIYQDPIEKIK